MKRTLQRHLLTLLGLLLTIPLFAYGSSGDLGVEAVSNRGNIKSAPKVFAVNELANDDLKFPESFDIEVTPPDGITVTQGYVQGVYTIKVTGESSSDKITVQLGVPDGWTGFVGMSDEDEVVNNIKRMRVSTYVEAPEWVSVDAMLDFGMTKRDSFTFTVDGEDHYGTLYLYVGSEADVENMISVEMNVTNKVYAPVFPKSFDVELTDYP